MKLFKNSKRKKNESGAVSTVELLIIFPLLFFMVLSAIDAGFYLSNRYVISSALKEGARVTGIYGGTGTRIGAQYGVSGGPAKIVQTTLESNRKSLVQVTYSNSSIKCGPNKTAKVGDITYCEINWRYDGLPGGSILSLIPRGEYETMRITSISEVGAAR